MTNHTDLHRLALDALEGNDLGLHYRAVDALRAALAQPAEPVAPTSMDYGMFIDGTTPPAPPEPLDGFGGNLDSAFDWGTPHDASGAPWPDAAPAVPDGWVMVPRHLSVDQLEAFVGRGLCCGTEPITEAVIDAGHRWTRLLGKIAAAPAQPAVPQPTPRTADCLMCGHCAATGERVTSPAKREHEVSAACWCGPDIDYTDPETGVSVYVHKEPQ